MNNNKVKTIFLIDDDKLTNFINKRIMARSGFNVNVQAFDSPHAALEVLRQLAVLDVASLPDVILLDVNMPIMDGWDFLNEYEKLVPRAEARIYMLSSSLDDKDIDRAAGYRMVCGFLSKPLKSEQLYELLEALVIAA
jgi:CheY-like chemotaxis protein